MTEKDIENLIAKYPDEFFPNCGFELVAQQYQLGRCRADIIFKDKYKRTIIIEVKKGLLSREASGQITEYYGLLVDENAQSKKHEIIELILCANTIPPERRTFLEKVGVECKELGLAKILDVASKYNYKFKDETPNIVIKDINKDVTINEAKQNVWIFQANPKRYDILNAISDPKCNYQTWLVSKFKDKIKEGDIALIWMSGKEAGIYALAEIISNPEIIGEFPEEGKYWQSDEDKNKTSLRVKICVKNSYINNPVFRRDIMKNEGLNNLSILKMPQGTNYFVTYNEWEILKIVLDKCKRC